MITTTLQKKFAIQRILLIVICLVMGLWGVYDYTVKIPARARAYARGQVCVQVVQALEPTSTPEDRTRAGATLKTELKDLLALGVDTEGSPPPTPQQAIQSIKSRDNQAWLGRLLVFQTGLREAEQIANGAAPTAQFSGVVELARDGVNETAEITPPSKFDRLTQWAFILCLPFVPVFTWSYLKARSLTYRLDEDGSLHSPVGVWKKDDIADIDMSRWMAKSTCTVIHRDGRRLKLDDYMYLNVHLIAGAIASEMYPDDWDEEAKQKKTGANDDGGDGGEDESSLAQLDAREPMEDQPSGAIEQERAEV